MKVINLIAVILLGTSSAIAQNQLPDPLPPRAFNKMIVQDITYAIIGENTPVTGVKIDISKPEGTISGMFPRGKCRLPWSIFSFELKGGVTDKNFSFLKGLNSANSAYEFKPSFHFILSNNVASYGDTPQANYNKRLVLVKNSLVSLHKKMLIDTFYVVTELYNRHLQLTGDLKTPPTVGPSVNRSYERIAAYFIPRIMENPVLKIDPNDTWNNIIAQLPQATENVNTTIDSTSYYDGVVELYKKYKKLYDNLDTDEQNKMISNASKIWTLKSYRWVTFTPFVRTEKVNEYYTQYEGKDSLYFKPDYRWYYGLTLYFNQYWVFPNKWGIFLRAGGTLAHSNNLTTLSSYNYETRTPFFQNGSAVTEKTKAGSAYNNSDIKTGFEKQFSVEGYLLPLGSMIPGLYVSANISHSDLYRLPKIVGRANDNVKVSTEGGLVFNINNRDKDNTLLSILTYFRYEDVTDKRRTSVLTGLEESADEFQQRNISIGIKVGIPINLPRKDN